MNDVISRQAVLKIIDGWYEQNRDTENIEDLIVLITYMDSVNPQEPKTGRWKSTIDGKPICSECGFISESEDGYFVSHYCPNCGAKMESEG